MKNIKIIAITLLLLVCQKTLSQEFEIPKNLKLEKESDYAKYEVDVLNGINWLENTGIKDQLAKRKNTSAFLMQWMTGTPSVSIGLQAFQTKLTEKNPDLLITFLGGWTKFAIENPSEKEDVIKANIAGFQSLIKVYSANKGSGIKKDKKIEKLIKLNQEELEEWVRKEVE
jgi:hypothetical protein